MVQATVEGEPIRAMVVSSRRNMLYVTSDSGIRQINLNMCKQRSAVMSHSLAIQWNDEL